MELLLIGLLVFGFGCSMIFGRELWWELQILSNQIKGLASERTTVWDAGQIIIGAIAIKEIPMLDAKRQRKKITKQRSPTSDKPRSKPSEVMILILASSNCLIEQSNRWSSKRKQLLNTASKNLRRGCEASLQWLKRDCIDLYQLNRPDHKVFFA
jgi:hypothetical protein